MEPIRFIHTADIHIGMENYGRLDPDTGLNQRVMDFLRRLSDLVEYAIDRQVDIFLFAGDAYRTRDPNPTFQREFSRRIKRVADAGIPTVLLVGNHDLPSLAHRASAVSIFDTLGVPNVYVGHREELCEITCRRGQKLLVATVPYPLRTAIVNREDHQGRTLAELDGVLRQWMIDQIRGLAEQARARADLPAVLMGHFSLDEASQGSEQNIMIGRDVTVPRSVLADPTWRYVALGHVHKHQSLNRDAQPPIVYSGSLERVDFGEEGEPKGFVAGEIGPEGTTWEFVQGYRRQARPFITVRTDVREESDPTAAIVRAVEEKGDLSDAVVRLSIVLRQEQEALLVERDIAKALSGAFFIASIQRDVVRADRQRLGGVAVESLPPMQLLERYFELKDVPPDRARKLLDLARGVMDEVDEGG